MQLLTWCVTLTALPAGPVVTLIFRDWMLRRRVRWVLKNQSSCPRCGYGLIGLAVSAEHTITCPECGLAVKVDPALGELAKDESGREQYVPAVIQVHEKFWTSARWKKVRRGLAAVLLLLLLAAGANELRAHWITYQARHMRLGAGPAASAGAYTASPGAAAGVSGEEYGRDITVRISQVIADVREELSQAGALQYNGSYMAPRPYALTAGPTPGEDPGRYAAERSLALRAMERYQALGVYDDLDRLRGVRLFEAVRAMNPAMPRLLQQWMGGVDFSAYLLNAARMGLARDAGDEAEFLRAYESSLAVVRLLRERGSGFDQALSEGVASVPRKLMRAWLLAHPPRAALAAVQEAIERQQSELPLAEMIAYDRVTTLDAVGWFFDDVKMNRLWGYGGNARLEVLIGRAYARPVVGSLAENRDAVEGVFAQAAAAAAMPPGAARTNQIPPTLNTGLSLPDNLLAALSQTVTSHDWTMLEKRADRVMIALEVYYEAFQRYPEGLEELVPWYLDEYPFDPVTGGAFLYRNAGLFGPGASYVLYLAGADGVDDGGAANRPSNFYPYGQYVVLYVAVPGKDHVFTPDEPAGPVGP